MAMEIDIFADDAHCMTTSPVMDLSKCQTHAMGVYYDILSIAQYFVLAYSRILCVCFPLQEDDYPQMSQI